VPPSKLASSFALVDHNSLLPSWDRPDAQVVGIIDHHDDEGKHTDASPRNITVPLGSCASLVAETFQDRFAPNENGTTPPQELATLLLSAIYIDTGGLKPKGKAEHTDEVAAAFLEKFAGYASLNDPPEGPAYRKATASSLMETKHNVEHLSSRDLLRRDYKQYEFNTADGVILHVGLTTVPLGTKVWLEKEAQNRPGYRKSLEAWALERKLDIVGVLTTFKSENKAHHRRELLILVGGAIAEPLSSVTSNVKENVNALASALAKGLEGQQVLELEPKEFKGEFADIKGPPGEHAHAKEVVDVVHFWRQNNVEATRKLIAPVFKSIIGGLAGIKSTLAIEASP
jgi:exopolyphosphatase